MCRFGYVTYNWQGTSKRIVKQEIPGLCCCIFPNIFVSHVFFSPAIEKLPKNPPPKSSPKAVPRQFALPTKEQLDSSAA